MSGICGIVNLDGTPVDPEVLRRMAEAASYLGRDGNHYWVQGHVGLAYLALHTTPDSLWERQPLISLQGDLVLVADARVDNRDELIRTLTAQGYVQAKDPTDADLILAAYRCWGEEACGRLQGAYAVAIWDCSDQRLILLRDRIGERAVYWARSTYSLLFASEPIQLLASGAVPDEVHLERLLAYLLGARPEPTWTYFREVSRLPESHMLTVSATDSRLCPYWDWQPTEPEVRDRSLAAQRLLECLQQAVARRLAQNGETGILLSGGLDSSSVAAEAATLLESEAKLLYAFTWASRTGDSIDERPLSSTFVRSRRNVLEVPIEADNLWPLSRYPEAYADPNDPETNAYPDLLLATIESAVQNNVRVLMSGIGGDPVVGWMAPDVVLLFRGHLLTLCRRWRQAGRGPLDLGRQLRLAAPRRLPVWLTDQGRRLAHEAGLGRAVVPWNALTSRIGFRLFALRSPVNVASLERSDRWSRRTGVRLAAPWQDADIISLVLSLPDGAVDLAPPMKSLLRQSIGSRLPEEIRSAPTDKQQTPGLRSKGLLQMGKATIKRLLSCSHLDGWGLVNGTQVLSAYRDMSGRDLVMPGLWRIVTSECWLRGRLGGLTDEGGF